MVIEKKQKAIKEDENWFMFSTSLKLHLFTDYVAFKYLYRTEPLTFIPTIFVNMVEIVEKSLKLYLAIKEKRENALSHFKSEYGHNIEKLRAQAETFHKIFSNEDIKQFTKPFNDKAGSFYQHLRYGSQGTIESFKTRISNVCPIVDKIFFACIMLHEENDKKLINHQSLLYLLIVNKESSQSNNPENLLQAVAMNNPDFEEYADYCKKLNLDDDKFLAQIKTQNEKPL